MAAAIALNSPAAAEQSARARIPVWQLTLFGFPAMPHAFVALPLYMILPTYYAANTSVTLAAIGSIAAISLIFDALNDPLVGYLCDRTKTRIGRRKPWMLGAAFFCALSVPALFNPPPDATILYFFLWSTLLYTGFTMFEIPRSAWSSELSRDYHQRARIGMFVALFNIAGSLSFYAVPMVMSFTGLGDGRIDGTTLETISWIYVFVMPGALVLAVIFVPKGTEVATKPATLGVVFASLWRSKPLLRFCCITMAWGLGQGSLMATVFLFQTEYMGFKTEFVYIMMVMFAVQIAALPLWSKVLLRYDRHRVWCVCVLAASCLAPVVLLLPRGPEALGAVLVLTVFRGILGAPQNFLPTAVLSDVIDYDTLRTGANKAANFFAFQNILIKCAMAVGGAIAFFILDFSGFKVGEANDAQAEWGLLAGYMMVPIFFHGVMVLLCWNFPIDRRRHAIVKRRLHAIAAREGVLQDA